VGLEKRKRYPGGAASEDKGKGNLGNQGLKYTRQRVAVQKTRGKKETNKVHVVSLTQAIKEKKPRTVCKGQAQKKPFSGGGQHGEKKTEKS